VGTVLDISQGRFEELAAALCATAREISLHLGHSAL